MIRTVPFYEGRTKCSTRVSMYQSIKVLTDKYSLSKHWPTRTYTISEHRMGYSSLEGLLYST